VSSPFLPREALGLGSLSEVFVAVRVASAAGAPPVALKRLRDDVRGDQRLRRGWLDAAASFQQLEHPNLVRVIGVGDNNDPWVAMELLDGEDLRAVSQRAARRGVKPGIALVVHVARSVAAALNVLHASDSQTARLHHAVVPGKVFVCHSGAVKLLCGTAPGAMTAQELAVGEARRELERHTSLEEARAREATPASDLWQLGVCLYELASAETLFARDTRLDTLRSVLGAPVPPLLEVLPNAPVALAAIIERLLERDPARRYESPAQVLADLATLPVSDEQAAAAARDALPAPGEVEDLDVTAVNAAGPMPVEMGPPPTDDAWEESTDVFSEELSDVFDVRTGLMPPPTFSTPAAGGAPAKTQPAVAMPPPASPTAPVFTAIGPSPDEGPAWPARVAGYRVLRPIDDIEPWQRYVVVDEAKRRFVLWTRKATNAEAARYVEDLRRLERVKHPCIAKPDASGQQDGSFFVAYRRREDAALETLMRGTGDQPAAVVALVLRDVLAALAAAHDVGLVHGSLRPRTIRLAAEGHAVLHGFGLGLDGPVDERDALRRVAYASPEQCAGESATAASDLYQCGALIHELLTGLPPFSRATVAATVAALRESRASPLVDHALGVPWHLERMHAQLLQRDSRKRYESAQKAAAVLQPLVAAIEATHDGGLGRYLLDPIEGHLRLSQRHAEAEVCIATEWLASSPESHAAAALSLVRAQFLDPANVDVNKLLRKTLARAGYSMDVQARSKLRRLEANVASDDDARLLGELVAAARQERRLPELVRYLFSYLQGAPDDDDARAAFAALTPSQAAEPFAALARSAKGGHKTGRAKPASRGRPLALPELYDDDDDDGDAIPWLFAAAAFALAVAALLFLLTR
jgi:serine/threonine protein kinase